MTSSPTTENPREAEAKPPFPQESLEYPGLESEMTPRPDYGEDVVPGTRPPARQGRPHHRRRQRHRPRGGPGLRPRGRRCPHLLSQRGLRCRGDGAGSSRGGPESSAGPGDISEEAHCQSLVERAVSELGKLDILVNNAAYQMTREGHRADPGRRVGAHLPDEHLRHVLPVQGGLAPYAAGQHDHQHRLHPGLPAVADSSSPTPAPRGPSSPSPRRWPRRAPSRASGSTWWPRVRSGPRSSPPPCREEKAQQFGQDTPLGRPGQPAELAPLFVFLASEESSYITGEVVGVTGGKPLA